MAQTTSRWSVYRRTLRTYAPYKGSILFALVFVLLNIGADLLKPWPFKFIIDSILTPNGDTASYHNLHFLLTLCLALVGLHLLSGLFSLINSYMLVQIGLKALVRIRCDLFAHLQRLSLKFHDTRSSGDSMFRVSYDAQAIQTILNRGVSPIFTAVITLVGTAVIMFRMNWQLTLLAITIGPLLFYSIHHYADRIRRESTSISESESELTTRTQEGLNAIRIVHAFGREDYELDRFQQQAHRSLSANLKLTMTQLSSALVIGSLMGVSTSAMIYFAARHVIAGTIQLGDLTVFVAYLAMLYQPLQSLTYTSFALEGAAAGAQRVFEILDTKEDVPDQPGATTVKHVGGVVEFKSVAFGYDDSRLILKDVSLRITPGQRIAFVGATGAGKTTLLSLIPRFYDPSQGAVSLDGTDLRSLKKKSLREQIGIVLQDTMLLAGTIRDNIGYGKLGATDAEIEKAAIAARVDEFVKETAKGYATEVGERGIRLSVGQRQRIGIARAFLKNAPILLLDEPTSALDPQTEVSIMDTLRELMKGRTTIIVTHRITTIHDCDQIFVLENGVLAEHGTGPELLKQGGAYSKLYHSQTRT